MTSHQLKSPLTVINGHLEMLEGEANLTGAGNQSLQTARQQCQRMQNLIEDLLLLSQVESYHLQSHEGEKLNIAEITELVVKSLDLDPDRGRIQSNVTQDLYLLGVRVEIEGIFSNLIENALKYSNPGSFVSVEWSENVLGEAIFSVSDEGPGIPEQDIPNVTQRYFRSSHSRANKVAGSGLGLSIVEQAAYKHGASLNIESSVASGSSFSVIFPSFRCLHKPV